MVCQLQGAYYHHDEEGEERSLVKVECFESTDHFSGSSLLGFRVKSGVKVYSLPIAQEYLHLKNREQIKESVHYILSAILSDSLLSEEMKFMITKLQSDENQTEEIVTFLYSRSRITSIHSITDHFVPGWGEAH